MEMLIFFAIPLVLVAIVIVVVLKKGPERTGRDGDLVVGPRDRANHVRRGLPSR